jgi:hypothetical protein
MAMCLASYPRLSRSWETLGAHTTPKQVASLEDGACRCLADLCHLHA